MTRKRTEWKFRGGSLKLGERTLIMGILNVTPDSFSDGGSFLEPDNAVQHALEMERAGADIIDVGAESTRPGSERISAAEELRRLIPVLKRLKGRLEIPISVDTYKPEVAERAFEHGAVAINDVSGLVWEPDLARVVRDADGGLVLGHTRGTPDQWAKQPPMRDVMGEIAADLESSIHRARRAGIELDHLLIDPGVGFGKRKEQNSELMARLGELRRLLVPVLVGPSRKSFLAQDDPQATEYATAAAVAVAITIGDAAMVRVHDLAAAVPVVGTCDAIIDAAPEPPEEKAGRKSARQGQREREEEEEERKRPIRPPVVGVVRVPDAEEKPAAAAPPTPRSEPLIRDLRPPRKFAAPPRRDDDDRPPRKFGPPRGRDEGDRPPRNFGP
ncbi:MAG TPA: dihydropteroate synthase, partial [Bryobacteraceae bacterium]|nr:dihydropteroate synthase [Bryobacteraceae bacterium]